MAQGLHLEVDSYSAGQEIPKVHHHIHKILPLNSVFTQLKISQPFQDTF